MDRRLTGDKTQTQLRARCTNVVHDLSSAEPRSKVEPSSHWITLHQVELESADPVQLNGRGYTVDDADWSTTLGLRANYSDVSHTQCLRNSPVQTGHNLFEF